MKNESSLQVQAPFNSFVILLTQNYTEDVGKAQHKIPRLQGGKNLSIVNGLAGPLTSVRGDNPFHAKYDF